MNKLIEELLKILKDEIPENQIRILQTLIGLDLRELYDRIKTPNPKEILLIKGIIQILDFGAANRRLTDEEMDILRNRISSMDVYDKITSSLMLFEELSDRLTPYMGEHPLAREIQLLDNMKPMAEENRIDEALGNIVLSIPTSRIVPLPTDNIRLALDMILSSVTNAKNPAVHLNQFENSVSSKIIDSVLSGNFIEGLNSIYFYTLTKTRMSSNVERHLVECYKKVSMYIAYLSSSKENESYNQIASEVFKTYDEYDRVLQKALEFKKLRLTI